MILLVKGRKERELALNGLKFFENPGEGVINPLSDNAPRHRIKIHIEGPLTSEALKFLSSRMSHYACWPPFS